jgi:hypothetical protein
MRAAFTDLSDPRSNAALGKRARAWVREHIGTWDDCAGRYVDLYKELCKQRP